MPSTSIDNAFMARKTIGAASDPNYAGALSFMRRKFTKDVTPSSGEFPSMPRFPTGRGPGSVHRQFAVLRRSSTTTRNIRSAAICLKR